MSRTLKLYNSFTRSLNPVQISGHFVSLQNFNHSKQSYGSFYICGPTVYSDSHLGHAITYIRADLFRRWMKALFNIRLISVMNITDVDDKIIDRVIQQRGENSTTKTELSKDPLSHPFNKLADKYYKSFLDDMAAIRVQPPDLGVRVSHQVPLIVEFIRQLERNGNAYIASSGDVVFRVNSLPSYKGRIDQRDNQSSDPNNNTDEEAEVARKNLQLSKTDPRDFVLWKPAKRNEPAWKYQSSVSDKIISGRPGWHVQCAAIAGSIFGKHLDFHFGGKDLEFPHHYNEEACSCAFHQLDSSETLHVWSKNWLHSGHLIVREEKMSKSLRNMVSISQVLEGTSVNALRLLCIHSHYRSDLDYNQDLIDKINSTDHKLSAFASFLQASLRVLGERRQQVFEQQRWQEEKQEILLSSGDAFEENHIAEAVQETRERILDGVCDDFSLDVGLLAILDLSKKVYAANPASLNASSLIACQNLLDDWSHNCGLHYGSKQTKECSTSSQDLLLDLLIDFRQQVRTQVLDGLKHDKKSSDKEILRALLDHCDRLRTKLDELGIVERDPKFRQS